VAKAKSSKPNQPEAEQKLAPNQSEAKQSLSKIGLKRNKACVFDRESKARLFIGLCGRFRFAHPWLGPV
jgi:hypothetical protein